MGKLLLVNGNEKRNLIMNNVIKAFYVIVICLFVSCSGKKNNLYISTDQFQITTRFIDENPILYGYRNYYCEYETAHEKEIYCLKWLDNSTRIIQYNKGTTKILIFLKDFGNGRIKSCFIMWQNENSLPGIPEDCASFDVKIDKYTKWIKTNMNENIIKELYPDIKCSIVKKTYNKIEIDFTKDVKTLEFFNNIKFIE
jgi:hypothetical protein